MTPENFMKVGSQKGRAGITKQFRGIYIPSMRPHPWKVPFRQVYADTFWRWLRGCCWCFYVTQMHNLGLRPCAPGFPSCRRRNRCSA